MGVRRTGDEFFATDVIPNGPAHRAGIENGVGVVTLTSYSFSHMLTCCILYRKQITSVLFASGQSGVALGRKLSEHYKH
jgi:hypothetical protein